MPLLFLLGVLLPLSGPALAIGDGETALRPLLAEHKDYRDRPEVEATFEGVLDYLPGTGRIGLPQRFCALQLRWLQDNTVQAVPLVTLDQDEQLAPFVSYRVEIRGKMVTRGEGAAATRELWVGQFRVKNLAPKLALTEIQPLARASNFLMPGPVRDPNKPKTLVLRSARDVVAALGAQGELSERAATDHLARALQVNSIDWKSQMVIHVASPARPVGGVLVSIKRLQVGDQGLIVEWQYERVPNLGNRTPGFPSETVLVPRIEGDVKFIQVDAADPKTKP
jgi:hypothetical protein